MNEEILQTKLEQLEALHLLDAPQRVLKAFKKHPDDLEIPHIFQYTAAPIKSKYAQADKLDTDELDFYRDLHNKVIIQEQQAIPAELKQLQALVTKYPELPFLENLLANIWKLASNREKYRQINEGMMQRYPDYLFARTNLAEELLLDDQAELVPELLNQAIEIYHWDDEPQRLFHISEVASFYSVMCAWSLLTKRYMRAAWAFSLLYHAYPAFDGVPGLVERWLALPEAELDGAY